MKRFFNIFCAVAVSGLLLCACEDPQPSGGEGGGTNTEQPEKPEGPEVPAELVNPEPIMRPDVCTPVDYVADSVEAGEDGASIRITAKDTNNFKFEVRPGANIQSYRLDVYPLCRLYNSLFEGAKNANISFPLNDKQVEQMIRGFIFDASGAGAYTFSINNMDDFLSHEFDWMNTPYAQARVVPDCEYIIAIVGCFDTEGVDQGDLSLCYVRTPYKKLIGTPEVDIQVIPRYTSVILNYECEQDAKYYYQWCSNYEDLQPYIDAYGDKLYIDFMRNAIYDPTPANAGIDPNTGLSPHTYFINFGLGATSDFDIMATAIGLDENQTPAEEFQQEVFRLKERPADAKPAEASLVLLEEYISASLFWVECYMPENCPNAYMDLISPEEYEMYKNYDEAAMSTYAMLIQQEPAFGFTNWNYGMKNDAQGNPIYDSCTLRDCIMFGAPDTEYYIAFTAMNEYRQLSPVEFIGPFKTDALVTDAPEKGNDDVNLTLTAEGATKLHIEFTYDIENTAAVHFQYIEGFGDGSIAFPTPESSREELLDYIYHDLYANRWPAEQGNYMKWTDILEPETRYTIAYVGEDWNGVLGEVKFATATTSALVGGNSPKATITGVKGTDTENPKFIIESNADTWGVYYMVGNESASGLSLSGLGDKKLSFRNAEKALEAWYNYCNEYKVNGGATLSSTISVDIHRNERSVALCIPLGGTPDKPVLGEMAHLIYDDEDGEFYDIYHYYPQTAAATSQLRIGTVFERGGEGNVRNWREVVLPESKGAIAPLAPIEGVNVINIDPKAFAAHPKATGR